MKTLKKVTDLSLVFLAGISILIMVAYGFYNIFVKDTTIGINKISDQLAVDIKAEKDLSAEEKEKYEERWFMEANYYSNAKNNGVMLQELNFNYFTSFDLTQDSYRASGLQFSYPSQAFNHNYAYTLPDGPEYTDYEYAQGIMHGLNYVEYLQLGSIQYDTIDGISYDGQYTNSIWQGSSLNSKLERGAEYIIKIDGRPFSISLTGGNTRNTFLWFTATYEYTYADLFACVFHAIESNSAGYGDYYLQLDISDFFSIKEYDPETGKFYAESPVDIIKNYAVIKFHYDENGAVRSNQSMFGKIDNNSKFDFVGADYWQERMVYTLTEKDLTYRWSESYGGYFVSLDLETKKFFDDMPRTKLLLELDLSSTWIEGKQYNVVGIDYSGFAGFDIDTITIKSAPKTLYVMQDAFKDAHVGTIKHSNGIVFEGLNLEGTGVEVL